MRKSPQITGQLNRSVRAWNRSKDMLDAMSGGPECNHPAIWYPPLNERRVSEKC